MVLTSRLRFAVWILILPLVALSAAATTLAQEPTPPAPAPCGLPTEGRLVGDFVYTLVADCTQVETLYLETGSMTVIGNGYTIDLRELNDGMVVSWSGTTLNISDLTILGGGKWSRGVIHSASDATTIEDVSFRGSYYAALVARAYPAGVYTLTNVLVEEAEGGYIHRRHPSVVVEASSGGQVNITNLVMRDIHGPGAAAIGARDQATVTISGCYTAERVFPQEFVTDNEATINADSATGACTGTIGNGDPAVKVVAPAQPAACGLPSEGYILESVAYNLSSDCQQSGLLRMPVGTTVVINGNGYIIRPAPNQQFIHTANNLTIRDVVITGGDDTTIRAQSGATLLLSNIVYRNNATMYSPILLLDSVVTIEDSVFAYNSQSSTSSSQASVLRLLRENVVTIRNSIFRDNTGGTGVIYAGEANQYGDNSVVRLLGCILFERNTPADINDPNNNVSDKSVAVCPDSTVRFQRPMNRGATLPTDLPTPRTDRGTGRGIGLPNVAATCSSAEALEALPLGSIACIFRERGRGAKTVVGIYGVNERSVGHLMLVVWQSQLDAAAGETIIACSPNGRALVVMWPDRNVTIKVGPDHEGKVLHMTFAQGLYGPVIGTITTYGAAPCLPYLGG